jgi:hypothetical protein
MQDRSACQQGLAADNGAELGLPAANFGRADPLDGAVTEPGPRVQVDTSSRRSPGRSGSSPWPLRFLGRWCVARTGRDAPPPGPQGAPPSPSGLTFIRARTSYQTGDGRDPTEWEDPLTVHLRLPTRAAQGRPTGLPDRSSRVTVRLKAHPRHQVIGPMLTGPIPVDAVGGTGRSPRDDSVAVGPDRHPRVRCLAC